MELFDKLKKHKTTIIISTVAAILAVIILSSFRIILPSIADYLFDSNKISEYNKHIKEQPFLRVVGEPIIDSIKFNLDSLSTIDIFNLYNEVTPSQSSLLVPPLVKLFITLRVMNTSNYPVNRIADAILDTITSEKIVR